MKINRYEKFLFNTDKKTKIITKMKKLILLSLLFVFACSKTPKENEPPKWINTFNNSDYYIESVGISGSKNESILKALMKDKSKSFLVNVLLGLGALIMLAILGVGLWVLQLYTICVPIPW